jgi:hypothetical protein
VKTKFQYHYPLSLDGTIKALRQKDADLEDNFLELKTKTDNVFSNSILNVTTNTTIPVALIPNKNLTLSSISHRTGSGTCSIQIKKNTTAIAGYSSPVAISTTVNTITTTGVTFVPNDYIECEITSASGLSYITLILNCTQII